MCGIIGYVGGRKPVPILLDGLRRLEYRGYDSAGLAVIDADLHLELRRVSGKLHNLEEAVRLQPLDGTYGVGHTRWATHGRPTEENAHPHRDSKGDIVVVHNGIVENYLALKQELEAEGHVFQTETDTEIIPHLIEKHFRGNLEDALRAAVNQLRGVFAIAAISRLDPGKIVAARNGPPVVVGLGDGEYFVASDVPAILSHTRDVFFLHDGDIAVLTGEGVRLMDLEGRPVKRQVSHILWDPIMAEKGGYKHFMLKEIFEQPRAVRDTILGRVGQESGRVFMDEMQILPREFAEFESVRIVACGTSWHAALAGKFMIERLARIPVEVDYGSEFRYRPPIVGPNSLTVLISQSGETADTLAAQREAKQKGSRTLSICNVMGSMISREGRRHAADARRARDRRGFDQGVHGATDSVIHPGHAPGAGARQAERGRVAAAGAGTAADSGQARTGVVVGRALRRVGEVALQGERFSLSRARHSITRSRLRAR